MGLGEGEDELGQYKGYYRDMRRGGAYVYLHADIMAHARNSTKARGATTEQFTGKMELTASVEPSHLSIEGELEEADVGNSNQHNSNGNSAQSQTGVVIKAREMIGNVGAGSS